jgi:hypothetical protein
MQFARGVCGRRIYWDRREPTSGHPAESLLPTSEYPALVRVSNEQECSGMDQCALLVFELNNVQSYAEFRRLNIAAAKGTISCDDYALACTQLEFDAILKTQKYFEEHPLLEANYENSWYYCYVMLVPEDFSAFVSTLNELEQVDYDPRRHFRRSYQQLRERKSETLIRNLNP